MVTLQEKLEKFQGKSNREIERGKVKTRPNSVGSLQLACK